MIGPHTEMIKIYFKQRYDDKGKKKLAASLVKAMKVNVGVGEAHPRQKHHVLNISKINPMTNQV